MKLLVILSRVPWPIEKGDKLRAFHQLKELSKYHEIVLFCVTDSPVHPDAETELKKYCSEIHIHKLSKIKIAFRLLLAFFSSQPFQVKYFYDKAAAKKVNRVITAFKPQHIFCQLIRCSEYVKNQHHISKTLDYMDALSKGIERRTEKSPFFFRPLFRAEARRLVAYENLIFDYFEHKVIISDQDRQFIWHPDQKKIHIIPNGVDTAYFTPVEREKKYDLVFNGNMNYPPNIDCVEYIVNYVLPECEKRGRQVSLLISGANPHKKVKALHNGKSIIVSGWVNDQRDSYASARIFFAPMQIGTGLQNKLLEAMSMQLPCITSTLANNALGALPGKHLLIGENPADYAEKILSLLSNSDLRQSLADEGRIFVFNHYKWEVVTAQLSALFTTTNP
ncbi:MAG: glycosyltransferase [Bacteroidota bacterium]